MPCMISAERGEARTARPRIARAPLALVSLALLAPAHAAAGENEEMADLRRMVRELQTQNRELSRRLGALEGARAAQKTRAAAAAERPIPTQDTSQSRLAPAGAQEYPTPVATAANPSPTFASPGAAPPLPEPHDTTDLGLDQRVKELEVGWAAQENATRQIIQNTLSKIGPNINSNLALSGVIEVLGSRFRDFNGPTRDSITLSTAELDFDIKMSEWLKGSLVLSFDTGTGTLFPTSTTVFTPGVDRFTLDRTHISIGDLMQFPIAARVGREVLSFGTSTGVARLDTLSLVTPLTTEVFENRETAGGIEFALPTPPLGPPPPPVVVPPVQPLVIAPLVRTFAQWLGYTPPPQRPVRLVPVTPPVALPPIYGSFMVYKGSENLAPRRTRIQDFNASLGFRTEGNCGMPYDELWSSLVCPWEIDVHVDYDTSVFDSRFLELAYAPFQIGRVPGMAASAKARFGPFALVGEVNSAIKEARFFDGFGILRSITPMAWQFALAYQFGWNPWVTEIGQQGDFISVAYSGSKDMAGVTELINGVPTRIGFVPQNRLSVTVGEWPMEALKLAVEYSIDWDYPLSSGGTGKTARGVFGLVQLNF
jgi:hypothetical protein